MASLVPKISQTQWVHAIDLWGKYPEIWLWQNSFFREIFLRRYSSMANFFPLQERIDFNFIIAQHTDTQCWLCFTPMNCFLHFSKFITILPLFTLPRKIQTPFPDRFPFLPSHPPANNNVIMLLRMKIYGSGPHLTAQRHTSVENGIAPNFNGNGWWKAVNGGGTCLHTSPRPHRTPTTTTTTASKVKPFWLCKCLSGCNNRFFQTHSDSRAKGFSNAKFFIVFHCGTPGWGTDWDAELCSVREKLCLWNSCFLVGFCCAFFRRGFTSIRYASHRAGRMAPRMEQQSATSPARKKNGSG